MDRRELLQMIAALTGCAFVGVDRLFAAALGSVTCTPAQVALFDEIAETILPRTDTPGAKDAQVGAYVARYACACYTPANLAILFAGLDALDARSREANGADFMHSTSAQKQKLLAEIDAEAKHHARASGERGGQPPHWFTLCKQLVLLGFFTSEAGATRVARYRPVPGPYKGVVPYRGETFWAW
ncbi:MAG TPA: gluconate 2-dehydrogenase subunit 3 family protein [Rhodanobacter sp.]|nr:gluconate 2-dehydrogenase subunit 3 family protein [Rhodanobacter sp.]